MKTLIWQNVTEGPMTTELKNASIVFLSEGDPDLVRKARPVTSHGQHQHDRIKGLVINWDRSQFRVTNRGYRMFHKSGEAEGWDNIPTPPRGLLYVVGYWIDDPDRKLYCMWVTHFLNTWYPFPQNRDENTKKRHYIVKVLSIPVVEELIQQMNRDSKISGTVGGGDTNSVPWDGEMRGLTSVFNRGLDRVWSSEDAMVSYAGRSPETGVGPQSYHHGVIILQKTKKGKG